MDRERKAYSGKLLFTNQLLSYANWAVILYELTKAFFRKLKIPLYQGMLVEMEIRFNKLQQVLTGFNTLVAREMTTFKEQEFYALWYEESIIICTKEISRIQ